MTPFEKRIYVLSFIYSAIALLQTSYKVQFYPYIEYLAWYVGVIGGLTYIFRSYIVRLAHAIPQVWSRFFIVSLIYVTIEELVAYGTGIGIFESGDVTLKTGLLQAIPALLMWNMVWYFYLKRYRFSPAQLIVAIGISGWINEFIIVPRFTLDTLHIAIMIIPTVIFAYGLLLFIPYRLIHTTSPAISNMKVLLVSVILSGGFALGGGIGFVLVSLFS